MNLIIHALDFFNLLHSISSMSGINTIWIRMYQSTESQCRDNFTRSIPHETTLSNYLIWTQHRCVSTSEVL